MNFGLGIIAESLQDYAFHEPGYWCHKNHTVYQCRAENQYTPRVSVVRWSLGRFLQDIQHSMCPPVCSVELVMTFVNIQLLKGDWVIVLWLEKGNWGKFSLVLLPHPDVARHENTFFIIIQKKQAICMRNSTTFKQILQTSCDLFIFIFIICSKKRSCAVWHHIMSVAVSEEIWCA